MKKEICDHAAALDTDNWRFRVIPQERLCKQKTIRWSVLEQGAFEYEHLRQRIVAAVAGLK